MTVPVRFVPRSATTVDFAMLGIAPLQEAAELVQPTKARSDKGRAALLERGVRTEATALNRLEVRLSEDQFQAMFDTRLETKATSRKTARSISENETFKQPTKELEVPEALRRYDRIRLCAAASRILFRSAANPTA